MRESSIHPIENRRRLLSPVRRAVSGDLQDDSTVWHDEQEPWARADAKLSLYGLPSLVREEVGRTARWKIDCWLFASIAARGTPIHPQDLHVVPVQRMIRLLEPLSQAVHFLPGPWAM